jgi:hypothetical protein
MPKVKKSIFVLVFFIYPNLWADNKFLTRISYQAGYAESAMREAQVEYSYPISVGYKIESITFGLDYFLQQSPQEGNATLSVQSKSTFYSLTFEYDVYRFERTSFQMGLSTGLGQSFTQTELLGVTTESTSQVMSYTNLNSSFCYSLNNMVFVRVTGLLQNSVLLNPNWQLALRSTIQIEF